MVVAQLDLFTPVRRFAFLDLRLAENAAADRIRTLERHGHHTEAADVFSAVTMMRLEVARLNGWAPSLRETGRARHIGGLKR